MMRPDDQLLLLQLGDAQRSSNSTSIHGPRQFTLVAENEQWNATKPRLAPQDGSELDA